jgi:hypothetical protein
MSQEAGPHLQTVKPVYHHPSLADLLGGTAPLDKH